MSNITVLMPVLNCEPYVGRAIHSISVQTLASWQLVIADNGSTDRSGDVARSHAAGDSRIRVIDGSGKNLCQLRNMLLEEARTEFVAWLDSDDMAKPTRLERQVAFLRANPRVVLVGTDVVVIDPDDEPIKEEALPCEHVVIVEDLLSFRSKGIFFPSSAGRRDAILSVGGLREEFPCGEDIDLYLRLAEIGQLANIPEPLTRYRWRLDNLSWSAGAQCAEGFARAVADARARNRQAASFAVAPHPKVTMSEADIFRQWGQAALHAGHPKTALKYARKALGHGPGSAEAWRLFAMARFPLDLTGRTGLKARLRRLPGTLARGAALTVASVLEKTK